MFSKSYVANVRTQVSARSCRYRHTNTKTHTQYTDKLFERIYQYTYTNIYKIMHDQCFVHRRVDVLYTYIYAYIHTYTYSYVGDSIHMHIYIYVYIFISMHVLVYTYV